MTAGRGGGSLMGSANEQDESSIQEDQRPIPVPATLTETISIRVCPNNPLGFNIRQTDNRVMNITSHSPLLNKMCIGDKIIKLNGLPFNFKTLLKSVKPHKSPKCSSESVEEGHERVEMKFTIERAVFSWSRLETTTMEILRDMPKNGRTATQTDLFTGRPLKRYTVILRRPELRGVALAPIGLRLRYDPRERVTVAGTIAGSVAAVHLRPGDIIKRVNGDDVITKTMCAHKILKSLQITGQVTLTVDVLDNVSARDTMPMPEDVAAICAKQIALLKSGAAPSPLPPISIVRPVRPPVAAAAAVAAVPAATSKKVSVAKGQAREENIVSDVEEGQTLKKAKYADEKAAKK